MFYQRTKDSNDIMSRYPGGKMRTKNLIEAKHIFKVAFFKGHLFFKHDLF